MKIVVLDGHTVNPDDLSWDGFNDYGELTVHPRTTPDQIIDRSINADVILLNKIKMDDKILDGLPQLKYIGLLATGYDNVDTTYARSRGITITNIPAYGTPSVAQHTMALLLEITNRVGLHNRSVHDLEWERHKDFSYFKTPLIELYGKTLGVIGYGSIGKEVCRLAEAFGMNVLVHSDHANEIAVGTLSTIDDLLNSSDFVTIHAALNEKNKGLINRHQLKKMKPGAYIINTSRGAIIDEHDLADALNNDIIAGAALDVLSKEPPGENHVLLHAKNCIITPHISWVTRESRQRLMDIAVDNLRAFLSGQSENVVN